MRIYDTLHTTKQQNLSLQYIKAANTYSDNIQTKITQINNGPWTKYNI